MKAIITMVVEMDDNFDADAAALEMSDTIKDILYQPAAPKFASKYNVLCCSAQVMKEVK
jgi:hypothetical protein